MDLLFVASIKKELFSDVTSYLLATGAVGLFLFAVGLLVWGGKRYVNGIDEKIKSMQATIKEIPTHEEIELTNQLSYLKGRMEQISIDLNAISKVATSVVEFSSSQSQELFASTRRQLAMELRQELDEKYNMLSQKEDNPSSE